MLQRPPERWPFPVFTGRCGTEKARPGCLPEKERSPRRGSSGSRFGDGIFSRDGDVPPLPVAALQVAWPGRTFQLPLLRRMRIRITTVSHQRGRRRTPPPLDAVLQSCMPVPARARQSSRRAYLSPPAVWFVGYLAAARSRPQVVRPIRDVRSAVRAPIRPSGHPSGAPAGAGLRSRTLLRPTPNRWTGAADGAQDAKNQSKTRAHRVVVLLCACILLVSQ